MTCHTTLTRHPPILLRRSDILSVLTSRKLWSIIRVHVTVKESRISKKERSSSWSVMGDPNESSWTEFIFCGNDLLNRNDLVQSDDQQIITFHISLSFRIEKRRWVSKHLSRILRSWTFVQWVTDSRYRNYPYHELHGNVNSATNVVEAGKKNYVVLFYLNMKCNELENRKQKWREYLMWRSFLGEISFWTCLSALLFLIKRIELDTSRILLG